jgi:HK97 family phage major capsid protein
MRKQIKDLHERAGKLINDMRVINDTAFGEKRAFTNEENAKYEAMEKDFDSVQREIKRIESLIQRDEFMKQTPPSAGLDLSAKNENEQVRAYKNAFFGYVRGASPDAILKRDFNEGTAADGGYTVPTDFQARVIEELGKTTLMRQLASVMSTESLTLIPTEASIPTFAWIAEKGTYGETDAKFGQISISAFKLGGILKISNELLQDSGIDIESYILRKAVQGIGYNEEDAFINGNGTGKPTGVINATVGLTTASASAVAADEIIDFFYSLDTRYRVNAKWLISDGLEKAIRKLKDTTGQYLWQPSVQVGAPSTILGKQVFTSPFLSGLGASKIPAIFGDFSYYQIADRGNIAILRLNELYAATGQVGFRVDKRVDGKITLPVAIRTLKCAAS